MSSEERRAARERDHAERECEWKAAMENARLRLIADHRRNVLRERVRVE
jgi:hypothetical protein